VVLLYGRYEYGGFDRRFSAVFEHLQRIESIEFKRGCQLPADFKRPLLGTDLFGLAEVVVNHPHVPLPGYISTTLTPINIRAFTPDALKVAVSPFTVTGNCAEAYVSFFTLAMLTALLQFTLCAVKACSSTNRAR